MLNALRLACSYSEYALWFVFAAMLISAAIGAVLGGLRYAGHAGYLHLATRSLLGAVSSALLYVKSERIRVWTVTLRDGSVFRIESRSLEFSQGFFVFRRRQAGGILCVFCAEAVQQIIAG